MASVTLKKIDRLFQQGGVARVLSRGLAKASGFARASLTVPFKGPIDDVGELTDYGFASCGGFIRPFQEREEIIPLLRLVKSLAPRRVMEIGTSNGGTLFLFSRVVAPDAHLVSLDLPGGDFGDGYPLWKVPLYKSFALRGQRVSLVRADSHDPATVDRVAGVLGREPIDFLFIDGDHRYEGVKADFEMYRPLVRHGGVVAFHDVSNVPDVRRYWDEVKATYRHEEFVVRPGQTYGIGVLHVDQGTDGAAAPHYVRSVELKIAIVNHNVTLGGGQPRVNFELTRHCLARGIEVTLLAEHVHDDLLAAGARWRRVRPRFLKPEIVHGPTFARLADRAIAEIADAVDLVVANGFCCRHPHTVNVCHFVNGAWRRVGGRARAGQCGPQQWYQRLFAECNARWEMQTYAAARHVVAVSQKVRSELVDAGVPSQKVRSILNGVDLDEFHPGAESRASLGLPEDVPMALFVGDIRTGRKNLDTVLLALQRQPDVHLAVVGDASRSYFPSMAARMGLTPRVHFLGYRRDVPKIMRACDAFVFPSRYEACSLALLEALASGLPVITAVTAGGSEIVSAECGHVMADPEDADDLVDAMSRFLRRDATSGGAAKAARRVAEGHGWARMAQDYIDLFEQIVGGPGGTSTPLAVATAQLPSLAPLTRSQI